MKQAHQVGDRAESFQFPDGCLDLARAFGGQHRLGQCVEFFLDLGIGQRIARVALGIVDLFDQLARPVNVNIEFTIDEGLTWQTARRFKSYVDGQPLGSGVTNLSTSPDGESYTFFWDFVNDVGFSTERDAQLRIRPSVKT